MSGLPDGYDGHLTQAKIVGDLFDLSRGRTGSGCRPSFGGGLLADCGADLIR